MHAAHFEQIFKIMHRLKYLFQKQNKHQLNALQKDPIQIGDIRYVYFFLQLYEYNLLICISKSGSISNSFVLIIIYHH